MIRGLVRVSYMKTFHKIHKVSCNPYTSIQFSIFGSPNHFLMKTLSFLFLTCMVISCQRGPVVTDNTSVKDSIQRTDGCCAPEIIDTAWYSSGKKAPFFTGLDGIDWKITTRSEEAQKYFNQGMMLSYGFNHAEAARSFFEASRQDTSCAMCYWGYALVLGPNYNAGMDPAHYSKAYNAVTRAREFAMNATPLEQDLIDALSYRYSADENADRVILDSAYADAMRKVYSKYSNNVQVASLFAESLMDQHPWNLWKKDGKAQPWTPEIITTIENGFKLDSNHAGLNHLYIHAVEMSQEPEKSNRSAALLEDLVPGSGHLVHMPSHTYIRTGEYHKGVVANYNAVKVDSLYTTACHAQGVYPLAYYPHNWHFLSACATLSGESKLAEKGADKTRSHAHKKLMEDPAFATLQHYYSIPWFVDVKLGLWEEIQKSEEPEKQFVYPRIIWNYAQGMASVAKNNPADAQQRLDQIKLLMKDSSIKDLTIWGINTVSDICAIAHDVLEGEILANQKKYNESIKILNSAVAKEDALNYDEPPDWFFSVRHHLGAVLLEAGKPREALKIYKEDLINFRNNGWAYRGMMNAYNQLKDQKNYSETEKKFNEAWKHADIKITSSRIM